MLVITGANGDYAPEEDIQGDVFSFYIAIPKAKFNSPAGAYALKGMNEIEDDYPTAPNF